MHKILLSFAFALMSVTSFSQTATNFNCNDCTGFTHDLFTELDEGKVICIAWTMPCAVCISGCLAGFTAVQSYTTTNPGIVKFYLADDYANSTCSTISGWANTNGMSGADAIFHNAAVKMSDYGTSGMPKVVVLAKGIVSGVTGYKVYYNQINAAISQTAIQAAIDNAVAAIVSVKENENIIFSSATIFPNPTNASSTLSLKLSKESKVNIEVQNVLGQKISTVFNGSLPHGENTLKVNTEELSNGNYFIHLSDGESTKILKLIVVH